MVMVKNVSGKWRICVDFIDLNKACLKDSFPLPTINKLVDTFVGYKVLNFMDAFSRYNQISMNLSNQEKMMFITKEGLFCYKAIPFGLKNARVTYQQLVNKVFANKICRTMEVYVNDMMVKSMKME